MKEKLKYSVYIRNFIFGVEDSLVSTVGLLSGIASQNISHSMIFLTGIIYISVEAFSMAVGSFLSEDSAQEYTAGFEVSDKLPIFGSIIMFVSFFIAGFIPILPYLLLTGESSLFASIILSLITLFILGFVSAKISKIKPWRRAVRMFLLGGFAIAIGIMVGKFFGV